MAFCKFLIRDGMKVKFQSQAMLDLIKVEKNATKKIKVHSFFKVTYVTYIKARVVI